MTTIRRLADSCVTVSTDAGTTILDPGFFTFGSGQIDLDTIGDVQRVCITHEHADHVSPDFVRWLIDRGSDVSVHANDAVAAILAQNGIEVSGENPDGVTSEDVNHGTLPNGTTVPNRAFTIDGVFTHPGDSHEPTASAPILALPLIMPWGTMRGSVEFALRLGAQQCIPIHDFYLTESARDFFYGMAGSVLNAEGVEFIPLKWGESITV